MEIKQSKSIVEAFRGYFKMLAGNKNNDPLRAGAVNLWAQGTSELEAAHPYKNTDLPGSGLVTNPKEQV